MEYTHLALLIDKAERPEGGKKNEKIRSYVYHPSKH